jgi:hypothetical protein
MLDWHQRVCFGHNLTRLNSGSGPGILDMCVKSGGCRPPDPRLIFGASPRPPRPTHALGMGLWRCAGVGATQRRPKSRAPAPECNKNFSSQSDLYIYGSLSFPTSASPVIEFPSLPGMGRNRPETFDVLKETAVRRLPHIPRERGGRVAGPKNLLEALLSIPG